MAKDNAVGNQKVFVSLSSVLELQKEIERLTSFMETTTNEQSKLYYTKNIYGLKRAVEILELPLRFIG